jgi:hypothetical protein
MDEECLWVEDADGLWETQCKAVWEFMADGPEENGVKFCPCCGRLVHAVRYEEEAESGDKEV